MTDFCDIDPITVSFVIFPFSDVLLTIAVSPKPVPLHRAVVEISDIILIPKL